MCQKYLIIRWRNPLKFPTLGPRYALREMSQKKHCLAWSAEVTIVAENLSFEKADRRRRELDRVNPEVN